MEPLVSNKKVFLSFEIIEKFTAGIELYGFEVKSLRKKQGRLLGAYVIVRASGRNGSPEAYLVGAHISPYQEANTPKTYDPLRARKLLLTKKELQRLMGIESQKGLTIVPIALYNNKRALKLEIGVARGKKKFDKREDIKKRDTARDIERETKHRL